MSDEDERALWHRHLAHRTWETYVKWAREAARRGFPWGLEFVLASRRYPRSVERCEYRSAARASSNSSRMWVVGERARAVVGGLKARGRRALRHLRRADCIPRTPGPVPVSAESLRGVRALLTDILDAEGARLRRRERVLKKRANSEESVNASARSLRALRSAELAAAMGFMRICSTCGEPESAHPRAECPHGFNDSERIRERTGVRFVEDEEPAPHDVEPPGR